MSSELSLLHSKFKASLGYRSPFLQLVKLTVEAGPIVTLGENVFLTP